MNLQIKIFQLQHSFTSIYNADRQKHRTSLDVIAKNCELCISLFNLSGDIRILTDHFLVIRDFKLGK